MRIIRKPPIYRPLSPNGSRRVVTTSAHVAAHNTVDCSHAVCLSNVCKLGNVDMGYICFRWCFRWCFQNVFQILLWNVFWGLRNIFLSFREYILGLPEYIMYYTIAGTVYKPVFCTDPTRAQHDQG